MDNKTFCRTVKSFFIDKVTACSKTTLTEKTEVLKKGKNGNDWISNFQWLWHA